ncbi:WEB family protein At4g27595, chloroplastic [Tribolium madens]|uniref:WEB family protein At4g27595, chloroplastic n=1 Tax=Tribolium madens TaxID=41895 RepID=UPI001CF72FC3|nr:WEB family protein At4g27595, chloroplastic [Tribolium madens]
MTLERAMEDLTAKMKQTDEKLDDLATQVGHIESEILSEDTAEIEVNNLLRSVTEVKTNYQNLRKEIVEVQDLQKQLSSSLQLQLKMMQAKCNTLKEKVGAAGPPRLEN